MYVGIHIGLVTLDMYIGHVRRYAYWTSDFGHVGIHIGLVTLDMYVGMHVCLYI